MRANSGSGGLRKIRGAVAAGGGAWVAASAAAQTGLVAATTLAATPAHLKPTSTAFYVSPAAGSTLLKSARPRNRP